MQERVSNTYSGHVTLSSSDSSRLSARGQGMSHVLRQSSASPAELRARDIPCSRAPVAELRADKPCLRVA